LPKAEAEQKVVRAAWSRIMEDYGHIDNDTPTLTILMLPEYLGPDIGTGLVKALLLLPRENGYLQASLSVQKENPALCLYERMEFQLVQQ
jgi:ribosomal-protein-alanine N-acetyltransferase